MWPWSLFLLAFSISLQTSPALARAEQNRHFRKAANAISSSAKDLPYQPRLCAAGHNDLEDLVGGTFSEKKSVHGDFRCPPVCPQCVPEKCQLPNCKCSNFTIPGKVPRNETPVIVIVTIQGAVENETYKAFLNLFEGLRNPNDCPATGTYFVSHRYTDYFLVQSLRSKGHEIADNTVTATSNKPDYWKNADGDTWFQEFEDEMIILEFLANVTDVRGFRAPYLQLGGDAQMYALQQIQQLKQASFVYDASRVSIQFSKSSPEGLLWPYTYDYINHTHDCISPPCPIFCHKGIWEMPLLAFRDRFKNACAPLDACNVQTYHDVFRLLYDRFSDHFDSNRAPLVLTMNSSWITNDFKFKGTRLFLEHALSYKEVYVVSAGRALEWIRKPVPLSNISHFEPWKCGQPAPYVCNASDTKLCKYNAKHQKAVKRAYYQFRTCAARCPRCYPSFGDPQGRTCR